MTNSSHIHVDCLYFRLCGHLPDLPDLFRLDASQPHGLLPTASLDDASRAVPLLSTHRNGRSEQVHNQLEAPRINSQVTDAIYAVVRSFLPDIPASVDVAARLNSTVTGYFDAFPAAKNQAEILDKVMSRLNDISHLPDELWGQILRNGGTLVSRDGFSGGNSTVTEHWLIDREDLLCSVMNSVLSNFVMGAIKRDRFSAMSVASYIAKKFNLVVSGLRCTTQVSPKRIH